ncbi:MAG: type IV pilus assembly protein PilM, partial [bacterium]
MESDNLDLNFLFQENKKNLFEEIESDSQKLSVDYDVQLEDFGQKLAASEPTDISLILSNKTAKEKIKTEFQLQENEEKDTIVNYKPKSEQDQSELLFDINEGPFISANELCSGLDAEDKQIESSAHTEVQNEPESELEFDDFGKTTKSEDLDEASDKQPEFQFIPDELEEPLILPKDLSAEIESPERPSDSEWQSKEQEEPLIFSKGSYAKETGHKKRTLKSEDHKETGPEVVSQEKPNKQHFSKIYNSLSSLFENSKLLGLDISTRSLKYVIFKKTTQGLKLIHCGIRPFPPASVDANEEDKKALISQVLQENFNSKNLKNTLVTTAVSGLEVLFHNIRVPNLARKEMAKAVPWACRKDFPFPIESTVIEFKIIENKDKNTDGKLDVWVVAAQDSLVSSHLDLLKYANITPAKVSTVPVALWNLFRMLVKKNTDKCYAIIDIGASSSHTVFINHGQLQFAREITTAGDDFSEALTGSIFIDGKELSLNRDRAEQIKREYGFPDEELDDLTEEGIPMQEISAMMGPVLERLVNEIQRTIDFYKEKFRIKVLEKIFLTGGGAFINNLNTNLAKELNLKVEILNPFQIISIKKMANQQELQRLGPRFAVAVGLALDKNKELNLLPQDLKDTHSSQHFKKIFRYLFVIIILFMTLLSQNVSHQLNKIEREFKRIKEDYKKAEPKRKHYLNLQKRLATLKALKENYKNNLEVNLTASNHLKAISHLIPKNIALTSLRIENREVKLKEKGNEFITQE